MRGARATLRRAPRGRELGRAGTRGVMLVTVRVSTITSFDDEGGEGNPAQGSLRVGESLGEQALVE